MTAKESATGAVVIARALKSLGVQCVFGVVGIPVIEIAEACTSEGVRFVGMRNEQSATYAANAWGYLTGRPGVALVVSGPGLVHALSGLSNAQANCWPMLLLAGSCSSSHQTMGGFQEMPQVEAARPYTKFSARPADIGQVPSVLDKALRAACHGRPGAAYVDLPAELIVGKMNVSDNVMYVPVSEASAPRSQADPHAVDRAMDRLLRAKRPLIIVGKGAAYGLRSSSEVSALRHLAEELDMPVLPTPMGKGLLSDTHPLVVAPARTLVLQQADCVLVLGARLNWMLHFAQPPRWRHDVCVIKVDVCAEEMGDQVGGKESHQLLGHIALVVEQLRQSLRKHRASVKRVDLVPWWSAIRSKMQQNVAMSMELYRTDVLPMTYYRAFYEIKQLLPRDVMLVSEGANTMDIGRTVLDQHFPRSRIDAGSFGTMGVGLGFAIAAQLAHPHRRCVCIQGDSAFGFSAMDYETVCRLRLPIIFVVINNNGIYAGIDRETWSATATDALPSTSLLPDARYEKLAEAFGGSGYLVRKPEELRGALQMALAAQDSPAIINVLIEPSASRKPQEHSWLTRHETANEAKL